MTKLLESGAFNINRGNYEGAYELENQVLKTRMQLARFFMHRIPDVSYLHRGSPIL